MRGRELIDYLQAEDFSHADLYRRARRIHERRLRARGRRRARRRSPGATCGRRSAASSRRCCRRCPTRRRPPSSAPRRRSWPAARASAPRVALIADGIGAMHGVTRTIEQIRERGVPGFEVEVVGTDPGVDRRLPAAAVAGGPLLRGDDAWACPACPTWSRPSPRAATTSSTSPRPGPAGVAATLLGRVTGMPLLASYHTELAAYARPAQRRRRPRGDRADGARRLLRAPSLVLSPSPAADRSLLGLGVDRGPDRPLGARRRHRPLRPREGRSRAPSPAS